MKSKPALEIDHATYKKLKHYNRDEMSKFCERLYMQGYNEGKKGESEMDSEELYAVIAAVRGIGPKRLAAIKTAVESAFKRKDDKS